MARHGGRLPVYYEAGGQCGDGRERKASAFVRAKAAPGDAVAALDAFEEFHAKHRPLLHVGPQKGAHLDDAVRARAPLRVLELGTYIGYSAIRIGRCVCLTSQTRF
eukprot:TRINITY_DN73677_c0_g1_i1.p2 TRINITY_DN73677_c0_g1~~TRINITY_DN73677_c0_g1_i1.p2  ORF type:complete len:116 (+),score=11.69 TRINITY_DN73677_c0_g1_i1:32-349(+)